MNLTESLLHMDYLQVTEPGSCEVFCGSNQEWFPAQRQRLTGCGPSAAASILFYMNRKKEKDCCGRKRQCREEGVFICFCSDRQMKKRSKVLWIAGLKKRL